MISRVRWGGSALVCSFVLLLLSVGDTHMVSAHWSASRGRSLYVPRYLVCNEQPFTRPACVGMRAEDWVEKALDIPAIGPGKNNDDIVEPAHDAALAAVYFNLPDTIPRLRKLLDIRIEKKDREEHVFFEKNGLRAEAAYALAHLGDRSSVARIRALLVEFETEGTGFMWRDTLDALAVLDGKTAAAYVTEHLGRATDWRMSMPGGGAKTDGLPYLVRVNYKPALEVLRRLTDKEGKKAGLDDHTFCVMMGTRVALGDEPLRSQVRERLEGNYSGTWMASCEEHLYSGLGNHPDDAPALIRRLGQLRQAGVPHSGMDYGVTNRSYIATLRLIWRLRQSELSEGDQKNDPRLEQAEANLRDGLDELERQWPEATSASTRKQAARLLRKELSARVRWPHVNKPGHEDHAPHFTAMHIAALAGLGDKGAVTRLYKIIDGEGVESKDGAGWIAAYWAVRFRLAGAQEHVAALMERGVGYLNEEHTGIYQSIRNRVVQAYAWEYRGDARWTVMLLDPSTAQILRVSDVAERALYLLSRHKPAGTCAQVAKFAPRAQPAAVEWAFLSLTALGQNCKSELEQLAKNEKLAPEVRGPAIEMLASMGAKQADELSRRYAKEAGIRVYLERARVIYADAGPR